MLVMNIVCVFGNGLDLAMGLHTSYANFLNDYLDKDLGKDTSEYAYKKWLVRNLLSQDDLNKDLWSDFELNFGCLNFGEISDAPKCVVNVAVQAHLYITSALRRYLSEEEKRLALQENARKIFLESIITLVLNSLINRCERKFTKDKFTISMLTFNYTNTLDKILEDDVCQHANVYSSNVSVSKVLHIHGTLGSLIFGVDNIKQITCAQQGAFNEQWRILTKQQWKEKIDSELRVLRDADVILFYGTSFGDTDHRWWSGIRDILRANENAIAIVCPYCKFAKAVAACDEQHTLIKRTKKRFFDALDVDSKIRSGMENRVIVPDVGFYNGDFLNLKKITRLRV